MHFKYRKKPASMNRQIFRVAGASRHDEEKDKTKEIKKGAGEKESAALVVCLVRVVLSGWGCDKHCLFSHVQQRANESVQLSFT